MAVLLWRHRHEMRAFVRRNWPSLVPSLVASAVFLLPLVINLFVNWPSPWLDYYEIRQGLHRDPRKLRDVWSFVSFYLTWRAEVAGWIAGVIAAISVGAVVIAPKGETRRWLASLMIAAGASLVIFIVYGALIVDHLKEMYLGYYGFAIPALIVAVGGVAICRRFTRLAPVIAVAVTVLTLTVADQADAFVAYDRGMPEVSTIVSSLRANAERKGRPVALTFDHGAWPIAVAVMQYGAHNGLPACVENPYWTWFVTRRLICRPEQIKASWRIYMTPVAGPAPEGMPLIRTPSVVVATAAPD
jgi:hypothetical protein